MSGKIKYINDIRGFAQRMFRKFGEDEQKRHGNMIFCEGEDTAEEIEKRNVENRKSLQNVQGNSYNKRLHFVRGDEDIQMQAQNDRTKFFKTEKNSSGDKVQKKRLCLKQAEDKNLVSSEQLSALIYNQMLILGELYQSLEDFVPNTEDREDILEELSEMRQELFVVTVAMGKIYQSLSKNNFFPTQNQQAPKIQNYCQGLKETQNYIRRILSNLRRLQRQLDNDSIEIQLLIIYLTLAEQSRELGELRAECHK